MDSQELSGLVIIPINGMIKLLVMTQILMLELILIKS